MLKDFPLPTNFTDKFIYTVYSSNIPRFEGIATYPQLW
jgi:hypothetical protein